MNISKPHLWILSTDFDAWEGYIREGDVFVRQKSSHPPLWLFFASFLAEARKEGPRQGPEPGCTKRFRYTMKHYNTHPVKKVTKVLQQLTVKLEFDFFVVTYYDNTRRDVHETIAEYFAVHLSAGFHERMLLCGFGIADGAGDDRAGFA